MAQTVCIILSVSDRQRLEAIVSDRYRQHNYIERAQMILVSAERGPVRQIAARVGVSRSVVRRWQQRFAEEGDDGLLRDETCKPGTPTIPAKIVSRAVALTCGKPRSEAAHWTGRAMAAAARISLRSEQRIWEAHRLRPVRGFKRSRDPMFTERLVDVVGLYLNPPDQAGYPGNSFTVMPLCTMIAYAFLQHRRLTAARREKEPPPQPSLPAVCQAIINHR